MAPEVGAVATEYLAGLDTLKNWISNRCAWLEANIPGHCRVDPTNVKTNITQPGFVLYPNPGNDKITITIEQKESQVELFVIDLSGKRILNKVYQRSGTGNYKLDLNVGDLSPGCYWVEMKQGAEKQVKKWIKL